MKLIEAIKLRHRANKYKNRDDQGGIAYINSSIQQGQTVLDIGSHKAGYLYWMVQRVGSDGKVFAFEPQTELYYYIKNIKDLLKWDNVMIEHLALSDSEGTATLYIPVNKAREGSSPGATIIEQKQKSGFGKTETVNTQTLDLYCTKHSIKPDFIKIDVEGNELKVFQGAINVLKNQKPKILVEIEARHAGKEKVLETFKFLQALNYHGEIIQGLNRIPLENFDFDKHQSLNDKKNYCNNFIFE